MIPRLSFGAAALCTALLSLDAPADSSILAALFGVSEDALDPYVNELLQAGLAACSKDKNVVLSDAFSAVQAADIMRSAAAGEPATALGRALLAYYTGQKQIFFRSAQDILFGAARGSGIVSARYLYGLFADLLVKMDVALHERDEMAGFLAASSRIQKVMQLFPWHADIATALYNKMEAVATQCGDKRSLCWTKLSKGLLNVNMGNDSHALENYHSMREGVRLLNELGDSSIITQSSGMVCFYYFMEGEFTKAINCGYSCLYMSESDDVDYERLLFSYAGLSAIMLGQYDVAVSILSRAIARARRRKPMQNVDSLEAILSYACLMMHEIEKAIGIIDSLLAKASTSVLTYAAFTAAKVLAYHYYLDGKIRQAHSVLLSWLPKNTDLGLVHNNCLAMPFMLEMLGAFHRAGLPQLFSNSIQQEIETALSSPSQVLQAVAFREKALLEENAHTAASAKAMQYLRQSLDLLHHVFAPDEQCKTLQAMARLSLAGQKEAAAREYAAEAWDLHAGNRYLRWPTDLRHLIPDGQSASQRTESPSDVLKRVMQSMRQQYTWETTTEFFNSLLCSCMAALNMASGGIFRCGKDHELLAGVGWNAESLSDPKYAVQQRVFEKARAERRTAWRRLPAGEGSCSTVIALFLNAESFGSYLLLMEGNLRASTLESLGRGIFSLLEDFCITEITMFLRSAELWKGQIKRPPSPTALVVGKPELFYQSPKMKSIVEQVDRLARKDTTILILGESGVGKELVARRLHAQSGRTGEFIAVNIANTPEELFESEFYGHEKGSFTGANYQKRGLFELADRGTLFIDEVGDIPPYLQTKLLRVLQEHKFMRVGGTRPLHSDFRLVAATNRDLKEAVRKGTFREDLYYRLSVVPVHIPPLRERPEDILYLAKTFLHDYAARDSSRPETFPAGVERDMLSYAWPGNVRELKNFVERFSLMPSQSTLFQTALHVNAAGALPDQATQEKSRLKIMTLAEMQDNYFERLYVEMDGVIGGKNGLAATLGISRTTAYAWIEKLKLKEKYEKKLLKK